MSRCRAWCFTVNNPTPEEVDSVRAISAERLVAALEIAPTTQTQHIQGYVRFAQPKSLKQLKTLLPRAHLETRKGTETEAAKYCQKGGEVVVNHGVDFDDVDRKRPRDVEALEVMNELKSARYGQVRQRHQLFFFWNRNYIKGWLQDDSSNVSAVTPLSSVCDESVGSPRISQCEDESAI